MTRQTRPFLPRTSRLLRWLVAAAAMSMLGSASAASSTLIRSESLRSTPSATAKALATLPKGAAIDVLARSGGWVQVAYRGNKGWVRLLSVRSGTATGGNAIGDVAGLTQSRNNNVVAVAGLRGLSEEDLKKAKYDPAGMSRLDSYTVSAAQAESFAAQAGLAKRSVAFLPGPSKKNSTPSTNTWEGLPQ